MRAASRRRLASGLLAAALATLALPAAASDAPAGDAERLFDEGRRLYDARRFEEACDLLAASVRAEEGVGSLGMLASCHEEIGKPATASREYERAADLARRMGDGREGYARARAASLRQVAGRLRFRFADRAPGEEVSIGGAPAALDGDTALVDPGRVEVVVRAPGRREVRIRVDVARAAVADVDVSALEASAAPVTAIAAAPAPDAPPGVPSARKTVGVAALVVGGTSIAASIAFGIAAIADKNASSPYCDASDRCTARGGAFRDRATVDGDIATATLSIGAASALAGVILLVTGHRAGDERRLGFAPAVGPTGGGASFIGAF